MTPGKSCTHHHFIFAINFSHTIKYKQYTWSFKLLQYKMTCVWCCCVVFFSLFVSSFILSYSIEHIYLYVVWLIHIYTCIYLHSNALYLTYNTFYFCFNVLLIEMLLVMYLFHLMELKLNYYELRIIYYTSIFTGNIIRFVVKWIYVYIYMYTFLYLYIKNFILFCDTRKKNAILLALSVSVFHMQFVS